MRLVVSMMQNRSLWRHFPCMIVPNIAPPPQHLTKLSIAEVAADLWQGERRQGEQWQLLHRDGDEVTGTHRQTDFQYVCYYFNYYYSSYSDFATFYPHHFLPAGPLYKSYIKPDKAPCRSNFYKHFKPFLPRFVSMWMDDCIQIHFDIFFK